MPIRSTSIRSRRMRSFEQHVVATVRLLAAALGVVLVDAADRLVGEAQPELVDDQAEVAEVQRAREELEAVVPRLALDVGQGVAVERVHAVADRRAQREQAAQRDPVARAVAAHDHVLRPRADEAPHEVLRVLEAAAGEDQRACSRARSRARVRPGHRPAVLGRLDRVDTGFDEDLGALAARGVEQLVRPGAARAGAACAHQPAAPHPVLEAGHRRVEREAVALVPRPCLLELVNEDALQLGVAARDPLACELV
jgi:hypothetical protein